MTDKSRLPIQSLDARPETDSPALTSVSPLVRDVLQTPGQPLDAATRSFMESRFAHDFSGVRVHTDQKAAESSRAVNALAYTVGEDVVFGAGRYAPNTRTGQELIAHELAHAAQQAGATANLGLKVGEASDRFEREADQAAHRAVHEPSAPLQMAPAQHATPVLRRAPLPGDQPSTELRSSPLGASMQSSITIDRFELGKAELTEEHKKKLAEEAATINRMLKQYPDSFVSIVGHTDAVGAAERNINLGQSRADAALAELQANGVPADVMRAASLGESSLLIRTQAPESRNRRVEVFFNARRFFNLPLPSPTPDLNNLPDFKLPKRPPILPPGPGPEPRPDIFKPLPPAPPTSDPIDDALDRDPILRALPKFVRDPLKDALKRGDEALADQALDTLQTDDQTKNAIKAAVEALLRTLKGERGKPPVPPLHEMPPSTATPMPEAPGENLFPLPPIKF